ncbi:hypothetical protein PBI_DISMAS_10 [Microbacterium phage Dismas]|uniref:Uncharacterized protein n=2 Tax=Dismasvirus dismas TaxID=2560588 RepID=A0A2H5BFQ0_9CAUD|nr:neck protein [Microbacterium phage Dismas]AUG84807.1 hypothetical protein PBI_DISMAS_10 [Microbacterium phage Dismas]AVR57174.1 hypothetical protein PBI_KIERAN_10 [Microbacterium phage Kieran]UYL86798.1 hypothetical protein SEA_RONA_10 [Microbacterium phage Rona]WNM67331.1 hypothetical protein SEA_CHILIPEPPER_10 [Microbacterium phage ChiliPepper]
MLPQKIRVNSEGLIALLKSPEVQADLRARGERIQAALPDDDGQEWQLNEFLGHDRAQVVVRTGNYAARRSAAEDMAFQRALDRGR